MTTEVDLWGFSLQVYSAPGVQQECLELQDRYGADVNLVLFCAYLGAVRGVVLTPHDLAAAQAVVSTWHANVVKQARALRQTLKAMRTEGGAEFVQEIEAVRNSVKHAELESERLEQKLLAQWVDRKDLKAEGDGPAVAAERNVMMFLNDIATPDTPPPLSPAALLRAAATFATTADR